MSVPFPSAPRADVVFENLMSPIGGAIDTFLGNVAPIDTILNNDGAFEVPEPPAEDHEHLITIDEHAFGDPGDETDHKG